jgi:hypothetical protein
MMKESPTLTCNLCLENVPIEKTSHASNSVKAYLQKYKTASVYCQNCMEKHHILVANWKKQNYLKGYLMCWSPILYYQDYTKHCKVCETDFVFSASEQKFWYETAQIFTDASPKMCKTCRQDARLKNPIHEQLKTLLPQAEANPTKAILLEISQLYSELGNKTKAGIFLQKAQKYA